MDDVAIRTHQLRKSYGDVEAVRGVDLEIHLGECFSLLGPNGAGKTTTTEILEGYRNRSGGEAWVLGVDPGTRPRAWRSQIGIVLQTSRDLTDLTVAEAVRHFAGYYAAPRNPDEVIEAVGLTEKRDARTTDLSGGQRRRLDVALGIIGRPKVLFLDEPTTGFDPEARRQFWALIEALKSEGTTILLTTHYLEEAEALADRVAIIAAGRVLACDVPQRLGGRTVGEATVTWSDADGHPHSEITSEPTALVTRLAAECGGEVPELTIRRPTLEDTYLELIAHEVVGAAEDVAREEDLLS